MDRLFGEWYTLPEGGEKSRFVSRLEEASSTCGGEGTFRGGCGNQVGLGDYECHGAHSIVVDHEFSRRDALPDALDSERYLSSCFSSDTGGFKRYDGPAKHDAVKAGEPLSILCRYDG